MTDLPTFINEPIGELLARGGAAELEDGLVAERCRRAHRERSLRGSPEATVEQ